MLTSQELASSSYRYFSSMKKGSIEILNKHIRDEPRGILFRQTQLVDALDETLDIALEELQEAQRRRRHAEEQLEAFKSKVEDQAEDDHNLDDEATSPPSKRMRPNEGAPNGNQNHAS